jgi:hypothetical protein
MKKELLYLEPHIMSNNILKMMIEVALETIRAWSIVNIHIQNCCFNLRG